MQKDDDNSDRGGSQIKPNCTLKDNVDGDSGLYECYSSVYASKGIFRFDSQKMNSFQMAEEGVVFQKETLSRKYTVVEEGPAFPCIK